MPGPRSTAVSASVRAVPTCLITTARPARRSAIWTFVLPDRPGDLREHHWPDLTEARDVSISDAATPSPARTPPQSRSAVKRQKPGEKARGSNPSAAPGQKQPSTSRYAGGGLLRAQGCRTAVVAMCSHQPSRQARAESSARLRQAWEIRGSNSTRSRAELVRFTRRHRIP